DRFRAAPRGGAGAAGAVPGRRYSWFLFLRVNGGSRFRRRELFHPPGRLSLFQRFNKGNQLVDLFLAHLALEGRHDVFIALDHLGPRVVDRLADVVLVGDDGPAVAQRDFLPVQFFEHGSAGVLALVATVTANTAVLEEGLAALERQ